MRQWLFCMAATTVLKKIVVWIAVLQGKVTEKACFKSKDNDLTFPRERLLYNVPVWGYKVLVTKGEEFSFLNVTLQQSNLPTSLTWKS